MSKEYITRCACGSVNFHVEAVAMYQVIDNKLYFNGSENKDNELTCDKCGQLIYLSDFNIEDL